MRDLLYLEWHEQDSIPVFRFVPSQYHSANAPYALNWKLWGLETLKFWLCQISGSSGQHEPSPFFWVSLHHTQTPTSYAPSKGPPTAASYCSTPTEITGTLHEDVSTFINTSRSFRLRMRNVSNKSCRENQNKMFSIFLFSKNRVVREIMSKNIHPEWL
jgi:hypothetical protein